MASIVVMQQSGEVRTIDAVTGRTLMDAIRDAGIDALLALCGGSFSCATCHVHIAPEWSARIGLPGLDESDLLDSADSRDAYSRLSCQVVIVPAFEGLAVTIAADN